MTTGNAREVLVAELLGDAGRLLDRIDALMPALKANTHALARASAKLPQATKEALTEVLERAHAVTSEAATKAVALINRETAAILQARRVELKASAQEVFDHEVAPALRHVTGQLDAAIHASRENPWNRWLTHAATGMTAVLLTLSLGLLFPSVSPPPAKASPTAPVPECAQPAATPHDAAQPVAASAARASKGRAGR